MKPFMNEDFLLSTDTAKNLYHNYAKNCEIIDYHNHLNPQEIYEDKSFKNMTEVWLGADHYKWRAMRQHGISERLITGDGSDYDKFEAWADTVQNCIGNPLYHWTHLELRRYFDVSETLSQKTAKLIWEKCNAKLSAPDFSVRNLLRKQNVKVLCTTDDPIDSLIWHKKLKEDNFEISVLPSFRPEKALAIEKKHFPEYIKELSGAASIEINDIESLLIALVRRLEYFCDRGCRITDHSLEGNFYEETTEENVNAILKKALNGESITDSESGQYRGYVLSRLGTEYAKRDLVMQLHIGALRNNSERMYDKLGADSGFDGCHDFNFAPMLSSLLNAMDKYNLLPRTALYCLNSKDMDMLSVMSGCFSSNEEGIRGKVQLGPAWWFLDHKNGMERQLDSLSDVGLISSSIGMLTDSRSFLSFPRHEYFRRILCNKVGTWVEKGEYPNDMDYLGQMITNISRDNAKSFLSL